MRGCFVTGTGTGTGKTVLAACLAASLAANGRRVSAFKPVVTGTAEPTTGWPFDHQLLASVTGQAPDAVCPMHFGPPMSPHLAAELAGVCVVPNALLSAAQRTGAASEILIVEGVGGLLVPLTTTYSVRDLARDLGLPVIIAARPGLGTISDTLLTIEAARAIGLDVRAVVLGPWRDQPSAIEASNRDTIARLGGLEVATLAGVKSADPKLLAAAGSELSPERWIGPAFRPLGGLA